MIRRLWIYFTYYYIKLNFLFECGSNKSKPERYMYDKTLSVANKQLQKRALFIQNKQKVQQYWHVLPRISSLLSTIRTVPLASEV